MKLLNQFQIDCKKNGFPVHKDYGLAIDENALAMARAICLEGYLDAGDLENADSLFSRFLKSPCRGRLLISMVRADFAIYEGWHYPEILEKSTDVFAIAEVAKEMMRYGITKFASLALQRAHAIKA